MVERFLRAKHWQVFLLIFAIPFILQMVFIFNMVFQIAQYDMYDDAVVEKGPIYNSMIILFIAMLLYTCALFAWYWSLGTGLQRFVPASVELPIKRFKFFLLFPLVYTLLIIFAFIPFMLSPGEFNPVIFIVIISIQLFSIFCIFYDMYFIAKTIKTVELQREAVLGEYIGEFFLIWFYFIGIWIIQPRVNRMVNTNEE